MIADLNKEIDFAFAEILKGSKKNRDEFFLLLACDDGRILRYFCQNDTEMVLVILSVFSLWLKDLCLSDPVMMAIRFAVSYYIHCNTIKLPLIHYSDFIRFVASEIDKKSLGRTDLNGFLMLVNKTYNNATINLLEKQSIKEKNRVKNIASAVKKGFLLSRFVFSIKQRMENGHCLVADFDFIFLWLNASSYYLLNVLPAQVDLSLLGYIKTEMLKHIDNLSLLSDDKIHIDYYLKRLDYLQLKSIDSLVMNDGFLFCRMSDHQEKTISLSAYCKFIIGVFQKLRMLTVLFSFLFFKVSYDNCGINFESAYTAALVSSLCCVIKLQFIFQSTFIEFVEVFSAKESSGRYFINDNNIIELSSLLRFLYYLPGNFKAVTYYSLPKCFLYHTFFTLILSQFSSTFDMSNLTSFYGLSGFFMAGVSLYVLSRAIFIHLNGIENVNDYEASSAEFVKKLHQDVDNFFGGCIQDESLLSLRKECLEFKSVLVIQSYCRLFLKKQPSKSLRPSVGEVSKVITDSVIIPASLPTRPVTVFKRKQKNKIEPSRRFSLSATIDRLIQSSDVAKTKMLQGYQRTLSLKSLSYTQFEIIEDKISRMLARDEARQRIG